MSMYVQEKSARKSKVNRLAETRRNLATLQRLERESGRQTSETPIIQRNDNVYSPIKLTSGGGSIDHQFRGLFTEICDCVSRAARKGALNSS